MGKTKKLPKRFFDEKGKEYVVDESDDEIVLKKAKGKKNHKAKKRREESSSSDSSSSDSDSSSSSSDSSSDDSRGKSKKSGKSSKKGKEKKALSEEAILSKKSVKDLDEKAQLENWLEVNKTKFAQAKAFIKKAKKIKLKLKELGFSNIDVINKLMNDASRRKTLLTTMEEMKTENEDGSLRKNADKIMQLRKGVAKIRKNGETAFEEAMQMIKKLSPEDKEKLFTDPAYQARNKDAKSFDELITKTDATSNEAFEQLKKSMISVGIDPAIQSNVLKELESTQKKRKRSSPEKKSVISMETAETSEHNNNNQAVTETASSEEPPKEKPVQNMETSAVAPHPVPEVSVGPLDPEETKLDDSVL